MLAESRERERVLTTILDTVDVGIVALDKAGHRLLTNRWQSELGGLGGSRRPFGSRSGRCSSC